MTLSLMKALAVLLLHVLIRLQVIDVVLEWRDHFRWIVRAVRSLASVIVRVTNCHAVLLIRLQNETRRDSFLTRRILMD